MVAKRVPKGRHFGSQNGTKIDPKLRSKFKSEKVASWDRLGSILGRFGGCPGGIFIDFLLVFLIFREHRRFRCKTGPKTVWGRNLAENDAKLGSQNDPKSIQNRYRKLIKILIDFWIDLGASWGDLRALLGGSWAPKIDFGRQKGAQREAIWEPKWDKNPSQNEVEI